MAQTNLAKSKNAFEHVLAESILLVALGQTIAFCEAKMLYLKANLLQAKALLQKALLDWSASGLRIIMIPKNKWKVQPHSCLMFIIKHIRLII